MQECSISNSDYIAAMAAIISLCAMGVAVWQGVVSRKHNRLTVRPHLSVTNELAFLPKGVGLRIAVKNVGFGPALINDCYFEKSGQRISITEPRNQVAEILRLIFADKLMYSFIQHGVISPNAVLPPGHEHVLLEAVFPTLTQSSASALDDYSQGFNYAIKYQSVYGEKFVSNLGSMRSEA